MGILCQIHQGISGGIHYFRPAEVLALKTYIGALALDSGFSFRKVQPKDLKTSYILAKDLEKMIIACEKEDGDQDKYDLAHDVEIRDLDQQKQAILCKYSGATGLKSSCWCKECKDSHLEDGCSGFQQTIEFFKEDDMNIGVECVKNLLVLVQEPNIAQGLIGDVD